jgi:GH15 family glucan-1,4-alpha-glucosidase
MDAETSTYRPIDSYGLIGNCRSALLVGTDGSVDWGCLPDFDSPAVFCRLLDTARGGYFQIAPTDPTIPGTQHYLRGSNVLQTHFASVSGSLLLTDFMPIESLKPRQGQRTDQFAGQRGDESPHCLVRRVQCTHGALEVTMALKVTPQYASEAAEALLVHNATGAIMSGGRQHVGLSVTGTSSLPSFSLCVLQEKDSFSPTIVAQFTLHAGEDLFFALGIGSDLQVVRRLVEDELPHRNFDTDLINTLSYWRRWVSRCSYHGPYADLVQRSALTLKMMTYAPTGALIAAPTTSLPEELGGLRNWDYRFTWLRDATFTLYALNILGFFDETRAFIDWLQHLPLASGEDLQIMYSVRGERNLAEQELAHLNGYRNSSPVRIGNGAATQKQLDIFGEVLDCFHFYRRLGGFAHSGELPAGPSAQLWELMYQLVEYVCKHWQEPDSGIWEVRGGPRHFVYSKVMCWVALDRGIQAAEDLDRSADLPRWRHIRDQIRLDILTHGYNHQIGAFIQSYGSTSLDASSLLLPLVGFLPPDDPRIRSTVERIMDQLTDSSGFVYRYHSNDGLAGREGTFTICTFWLIDNLAMQGRVAEAKALFERVLSYAGHLGLFSEEIDTTTSTALGNYPQAFTHLALINSALNLQKAEWRLADPPFQHATDLPALSSF